MIEHDIDFIGKLCDPIIVMAEGSMLMTGTFSQVQKMKKLLKFILVKIK